MVKQTNKLEKRKIIITLVDLMAALVRSTLIKQCFTAF